MKSFQQALEKVGEFGIVEKATKAMALISGLPGARLNEVVLLESGQMGQVLFAHPDQLEVMLLSAKPVKNGTRAARTNQKLAVPVGQELLGQVVNSLGRRLYPKGPFQRPAKKRVLNRESPGISQRIRIDQPLTTGVALVDTLIPLGKGQRELVIGDRKTGKTSFLLQTVLHQARQGMFCIWAVIGKENDEVRQIDKFLTDQAVSNQVCLIAASSQAPTSLIFLAPYTALTLAEYFRDQGLSTLVILDDLTLHAKFYRELTLLAGRFPGRDAYPVDIFFSHASILEKGGNFKINGQQASTTILATAETNQGDLSGYIQTNLMSMTDGHIFFDNDLFSQGRRPAINPFLSVTRVGRQTQTPLKRQLNHKLTAFLTYYQKLVGYTHFGAELTEAIKSALTKGERLKQFFDQGSQELIPPNLAVFLLARLWQESQPKLKTSAIISKYQQNKTFRQKIDQITTKSKDLTALFNKVKKFKI